MGIAIRHSRGSILFYTAGSRKDTYSSILQGPERTHTFPYCRVQKWVGGIDNRGTNKLYPRERHFFVKEKYVEDVKQEEKHVPDLLEAIMRPTDPVKEELRPNLFKTSQFRPEIIEIRV